jgi:hypothetical protein
VDLMQFRTGGRIPEQMVELLRVNKYQEGRIGYLTGKNNRKPIDFYGRYDGSAEKPDANWFSQNVKALETITIKACAAPSEPPPRVKGDEVAAWLKASSESELTFVTLEGKEQTRSIQGFQGKRKFLEKGGWFILFGDKGSKPV